MTRAELLALLILLAGIGCVVAGVYLLAGTGWALLAAGASCVIFGSIVMRGFARIAQGADIGR